MSNSAYRRRAERALGRPLRRSEHVHHHSETQLVICDPKYHKFLHRRMRELGMASPELPMPMLRISAEVMAELRRRARLEHRTLRAVAEYAILHTDVRP